MSLTRRLAAGLPVAGITALAALAFTGAPAAATGDEAVRAAHPAVMTTPCAEGERGANCDYGYGDEAPNDNATTNPTRGQSGYGGESPSTPPTTPTTPTATPSTPTASVDTVPPGGELPAESPSASTAASPSPSTPGGGVSAGGTLPKTGAPMGLTIAVGGAMVLAGAGAVAYSRRRKV